MTLIFKGRYNSQNFRNNILSLINKNAVPKVPLELPSVPVQTNANENISESNLSDPVASNDWHAENISGSETISPSNAILPSKQNITDLDLISAYI